MPEDGRRGRRISKGRGQLPGQRHFELHITWRRARLPEATQNDLVGAELVFRALPGFLGGAHRPVRGGLDLAPDFGIFRPTLVINGGGVYGMGVQDGFVVGPEIRFDIAPVGGFNIGIKAAYDYQFRNAGWDEGILWAGLDLGIRF